MKNKKAIKLYDLRTWPKDIKLFFSNQMEYCFNKEFERIIKNYYLIGYHNSKILNVEDFLKEGLQTLNKNTIKIIKDNICKITNEKDQVISAMIDDYLDKNNYDNRYNLLFFGATNKNINCGYNYILDYYGGEIAYNALPNYHTKLLENGTPCIIEFVFKYEFLSEYKREYVYEMMFAKFKNNRILEKDFSINYSIPIDYILTIKKILVQNNTYKIGETLYRG